MQHDKQHRRKILLDSLEFYRDSKFILMSKDLDEQFIIKISEKKRRFEVILASLSSQKVSVQWCSFILFKRVKNGYGIHN